MPPCPFYDPDGYRRWRDRNTYRVMHWYLPNPNGGGLLQATVPVTRDAEQGMNHATLAAYNCIALQDMLEQYQAARG